MRTHHAVPEVEDGGISSRLLDRREIDDILSIYKAEHKYIVEADLADVEMTFKLRQIVYPFTVDEIFDYITAPTSTLLVCQMTYVLIGGLVLIGHPVARVIGGWERFLSLRNTAQLRIGNMETKFAGRVYNKEPIGGKIGVRRAHEFGSIIHCKLDFDIGSGIYGSVHGIIMESQ